MLETIKKKLNDQRSYIDYIRVRAISVVSSKKKISKVKKTQSNNIWNLLLNDVGKISKVTHDPDRIIINFSSYRLNKHKICLCVKT